VQSGAPAVSFNTRDAFVYPFYENGQVFAEFGEPPAFCITALTMLQGADSRQACRDWKIVVKAHAPSAAMVASRPRLPS
jgi:hypothetical protein